MKSSKFLPITALSVLMFAAGGTAAPAMAGEIADCMKGSPQTAIHSCTRIIDTGFADGMRVSAKNLAKTYRKRGTAYSKNGSNRRAIEDFARAIELNPGYALAYGHRGWAYYKLGNYDQAKNDYTRAIELNPTIARAHHDLGWVHSETGNFDQAIAHYSQAIRVKPVYPLAYLNRALTHFKIGKPSLALQDVNNALKLNAKDARAYALRGKIQEALGQPLSAIADYRKALDLDASLVSTKQALNTLSYGGKLTQGAHKVVFIPGMTIGLAPSPGFELGTNFSGFKHEDRGITISVLELPAQVFVHMKTGFAEGTEAVNKNFASQGITVRTITPVTIDGAEGLIVASTQTLRGKKMKLWILVLGGKMATALIYVTAPVEQELSDARVTTMLESIRFRDAPSLQTQINILPYRFGNMAGFRVWRTMFGNMALLTNAAKGTAFGKDWPMIVVMRLKCAYPKDATPAQFAEQFFSEFKNATVTKIHKTVELTVAGANGYEMSATGIDTKTNKPVKISLWFRYEAGHLLGLLAMVKPADHKVLRANLRKLAANIHNK